MKAILIIILLMLPLLLLYIVTHVSREVKLRKYDMIVRREGKAIRAKIETVSDCVEAHRICGEFAVDAQMRSGIISKAEAAKLRKHIQEKYG